MPALMNMPEVMANALEATLSSWLKKEGETVEVGDAIAEVETEKATVEIPAEHHGVVARLLVEEGASVEVGAPILVIRTSGETDEEVVTFLRDAGTQTPAAAPEDSDGANPVLVAEVPRQAERRFSSPLARRLARENHVDVAVIPGSGPGGRIVRRDVEQVIAGRADSSRDWPAQMVPVQPTAAGPVQAKAQDVPTRVIAVPHTKMRRAISRRLTESKTTVPHFYLTADVRVDALLTLRKQVNESATRRITVNDLIVKAVGLALLDTPAANCTWSDEAQLQHTAADISVAIAVDGGLLTPVVRSVDSQSLSAVSAAIGDFVERAKAGKIRQEELTGGSFSVTNLGMFGTRQFSAILNPPQSAILAVGAAEPRAVVVDGSLAVATVMTCTLSADHRVIDGAVAAQWMQAFKARIENPLTILI